MKKNKVLTLLIVLVLSAIVFVIPVLAIPILIGGTDLWGDWAGAAALTDTIYDDWNSPQPTDLTEFRAYVTDDGVYLLMAVDDTVFDNQGITMGITYRGADGIYYRIYVNTTSDPAIINRDYLGIFRCTDATCNTQTPICDGDSKTVQATCDSILYAYGPTWPDPWPATTYITRANGDCSDAYGDPSWTTGDPDCLLTDFAVELFIPWTYLGYSSGGSPIDLSTIFLQYATYPSSPSVATKDFNTNGIYCINPTGTDPYNCYPSTPTAIEGLSFSASSRALPVGLALGGVGLVLIAGVLLSVYLRRRVSG